jgi:hypothetical protein
MIQENNFFNQVVPDSHTFTLYGVWHQLIMLQSIFSTVTDDKLKLKMLEDRIKYLEIGINNSREKNYEILPSANPLIKQSELS